MRSAWCRCRSSWVVRHTRMTRPVSPPRRRRSSYGPAGDDVPSVPAGLPRCLPGGRPERGVREVVSVHLSADLSGTCDAARLGGLQAPLPVTVVDSRQIGMSLSFCVRAAAEAADTGAEAEVVVAAARARAAAVRTFLYVHTLEHLRRGGRLSGPRERWWAPRSRSSRCSTWTTTDRSADQGTHERSRARRARTKDRRSCGHGRGRGGRAPPGRAGTCRGARRSVAGPDPVSGPARRPRGGQRDRRPRLDRACWRSPSRLSR